MNPGMSPAVQAALARRNTGGPVPQLQQTSPSMPMASGTPPSPIPQSAMTKSSGVPKPPKTGSLSYAPQNQSDQIVSALIETLKGNKALDKEKLKMAQGIQPPQPQAPQLSMNQPPPANMGSGVFGSPTTTAVANQQGNNPLSAGPTNPF